MNVIQMLVMWVISAGLLGIGYLLSLRWGTLGFVLTGVPVGLYWAVVLFFSFRALAREARQVRPPKR